MWDALKQAIGGATGMPPAALHVYVAIAIFVVALILFRRAGLAVLIVFALQLLNEALDAFGDMRSGVGFKLNEAVIDTAITMATAAVLWALTAFADAVRPGR
ncbi:hypothetical protein [Devosia sp.]|uniref:hypothetical protein n=1 Tax=Devosia sp. TaxID=1871048 RepID=UPI003A8E397E